MATTTGFAGGAGGDTTIGCAGGETLAVTGGAGRGCARDPKPSTTVRPGTLTVGLDPASCGGAGLAIGGAMEPSRPMAMVCTRLVPPSLSPAPSFAAAGDPEPLLRRSIILLSRLANCLPPGSAGLIFEGAPSPRTTGAATCMPPRMNFW